MLLDYIIENKEEILNIFNKYGANNVVIIGSVSRGEESEKSDIDFVVDLTAKSEHHRLQAHADLIGELKEYFNRDIDLAFREQIEENYPTALKNGFKLG